MKKIISILFLLIICIQCLPVKELGKSLFDSSLTEEEMCEKAMDKKEVPDTGKEFYLDDPALRSTAQNNKKHFFRIYADLFAAPAAEVTTPPPNA